MTKSHTEKNSTIKDLRHRVKELEAQLSAMDLNQAHAAGKNGTLMSETKSHDMNEEVRGLKSENNRLVKDLTFHEEKLATLKSDMAEMRSDLKSAREDRDWHRTQHLKMLDQRTAATSTTVQSLESEVQSTKAAIMKFRKIFAHIVTDVDCLDSPYDLWRCKHAPDFAQINKESCFTLPVQDVWNHVNKAMRKVLNDQEFRKEYMAVRERFARHALEHEKNGHGSVSSAQGLLETCKKHVHESSD